MKVELLYFEGCPNADLAEQGLRQALIEGGSGVEVVPVVAEDDEDAQKLRFAGSPTIRIDGEDAFPVAERESWTLTCRTYATPEGLRGAPTVDMLRSVLRQH